MRWLAVIASILLFIQVGCEKPSESTDTPTDPEITVPAVKPLSVGRVRINNGRLETDFTGSGTYTSYYIKGVAFSPTPISRGAITQAQYDRCIEYLKLLNANTIRTYSGVDKYLLTKCAENNIRVIVSFWVDTKADLGDTNIRKTMINGFAAMVKDLKDYPGVLMWNLGNEQNYVNGSTANWYTLAQEMAIAAYKVEGTKYHPVCINNGDIANIGSKVLKNADSSLTYIDAWASNIYKLNLTPSFTEYNKKTTKPLVVTEFGIDAYDNRSKLQYESTQAAQDSVNWMQIKAASRVLGATVFEFTDEWWKDDKGQDNVHNFGGYVTSEHPDGYSNEEWWGLIEVFPDGNGDGLDEWRIRKAFEMFSRNWK